jgi:hypothetical protein
VRKLVIAAVAVMASACGAASELGIVPTPPTQDAGCWFLADEPIGWAGYTTLGELGMGGRDGRWNGVRVYAWITENRIDLWGGAELTQAVCTVTDDPEYIEQLGGSIGWNEYPVVNGMPDVNDDPP